MIASATSLSGAASGLRVPAADGAPAASLLPAKMSKAVGECGRATSPSSACRAATVTSSPPVSTAEGDRAECTCAGCNCASRARISSCGQTIRSYVRFCSPLRFYARDASGLRVGANPGASHAEGAVPKASTAEGDRAEGGPPDVPWLEGASAKGASSGGFPAKGAASAGSLLVTR